MFQGEGDFTEWKQAYRVLGVPLNSSAHSIKQAHRRLSKRWHPDLYASETAAHVEATRMMALINGAYSNIANAPLRYYIEASPQPPLGQRGQTAQRAANEPGRVTDWQIRKTDKVEFWVRFVCGGLFGVFVILDVFFSIMPDSLRPSRTNALGALALILGFGFAAAQLRRQVLVFDSSTLVALAVNENEWLCWPHACVTRLPDIERSPKST